MPRSSGSGASCRPRPVAGQERTDAEVWRVDREADGGGVSAPTPVTDLNTAAWEFNPAISADGTRVVFTSINRPGGSGLGDLFTASGGDGAWSSEEPAPFNTPADEYHASFSPDGDTFYFVRRVGHGDLYEAAWPAP